MTYILTGNAICLQLHTGFISFNTNTEFYLKAVEMQAESLYSFVS